MYLIRLALTVMPAIQPGLALLMVSISAWTARVSTATWAYIYLSFGAYLVLNLIHMI